MPTLISQHDILTVPGWHGSSAEHWQSIWERAHPAFRRVEQHDWKNADPAVWADTLEGSVASAGRPVVLVAHSLGVLTVVQWAAQSRYVNKVHAAFLVAPPDVENYSDPACCLSSFAPIPRHRLSFDALVVGSENDQYARCARVEQLAADWGAEYVCAGLAGHINVESGHGPWPQGEELFVDFLARRQGAERRSCQLDR
jgi:uncharacterized protein